MDNATYVMTMDGARGPWLICGYRNGWCVQRVLLGTAKKYCRTTVPRTEYLNGKGKVSRQRYEFATVADAQKAISTNVYVLTVEA